MSKAGCGLIAALTIFRIIRILNDMGLIIGSAATFKCPPIFFLLSVGGQPPQKLRYFHRKIKYQKAKM